MRNFLSGAAGLFLIGCSGAAYPLFIAPLAARTQIAEGEIKDIGEKIGGVMAQFPDLENLRLQLQEEESKAIKLKDHLSRVEKGVLRESEFFSIAGKGGKVDSVQQIPQGPYRHQRLEIERRIGSDKEWMTFLKSLESSSPYLRVQRVRMRWENPGASGSLLSRAEVEVLTR